MHNFHFRTDTNILYHLPPRLTLGMMMDGPSLEVGAAAVAIGNRLGNQHGRVNHHGTLLPHGRNHQMIGVNQLLGNQPILGQVASQANGDHQQMMMTIGQAVVRQVSMMTMIGVHGLARRVRMMMIGEAPLLRVVIGIRRDGVGIR